MEAKYRFVVATRCFTYNQAQFIKEALRGFSMQETSFPVVYVVVDDASVDGEQTVLRKWCDSSLNSIGGKELWREMPYGFLAEGYLKGKNNSFFTILLLKENYYRSGREIRKFEFISEWFDDAKYQALCEGDDYWTDPLKLKKQVDFMDANPEYGMCHTDFDLSDGRHRHHYKEKYPDGNYFPGCIIHENISVGFLTVLYRKEAFDKTPKYYMSEKFVAGDKARWYELAKEARIKYLPEVTACYRVLPESASHYSSLEAMLEFREGLQHIRRFYADKFGVKISDFRNYYSNCLKMCYVASNAEKAEYYYQLAKKHKSITYKGVFFYLGAKYTFLKKLVGFIAHPK